ncbi:P-loop containing nucleoside triphosphate hydrolase protein [Lanmaoa asiatica]|nr:P-loop containing nucleoside triphosphate hydrolase protein [Lanmaoa asiatica]
MSLMSFWKPGTVAPGSSLDRLTRDQDSVIPSAPSDNSLPLQAQRERLPIAKYRGCPQVFFRGFSILLLPGDKLLYCIEQYPIIIVVGQTGSGKTTRTLSILCELPQYLLEAGWAAEGNVIACTQPRRVAATSVAARVAAEVGSVLGEEVGYTIRFEDVSDKDKTRIRYMTDGMLFREALLDPLLSRYSIDEAHERSLYTDLLLGVLKKIRRKRPSLRIIVSSATLDAMSFHDYFCSGTSPQEATIISLEGRMYPVEIAYLEEPTTDYIKMAVEVTWKINLQHVTGDILIFLTGREDIERFLEAMTELVPTLPRGAPQIVPLALHSGLSTEEQLRVFSRADPNSRKVVAATNIAEASVTIDGVKFVVDCGFVKIRSYNPSSYLSSLSTVPISLASATQRAGRAGRTSPGICYRLYPEAYLALLPATTPPEITRTDMTTPILQLKSLGVDDLMKFEWISVPPAEGILRALEGLVTAGMVGEDGRLTVMGQRVAECPIELRIARMVKTDPTCLAASELLVQLFSSKEFSCGEEILTIAAMISIQDIFVIPDGAPGALAELERRKFTAEEGVSMLYFLSTNCRLPHAKDHLTLLNAYNAFTRYGRSSSWCKVHALNFRAMSRAVSIRSQLSKYMTRFDLPKQSCEGDAKRLRQCLRTRSEMGASQSKPDTHPKVFHPEPPIEISPDVVNTLSARLVSEETMPERQFAIDSHIRERIQRELTALRTEEETVQLEIHRALEKENLDREMSMVEDGSTHGGLKAGVALIGDLEEIKEKIDRFQTRRQLGDFPSVKETGEAIASCYKYA